jgi:hypothetical protein
MFGSLVVAVAARAPRKGRLRAAARVVPDRRIAFRIGIALGNVVIEGEDLLGDAVNGAARLEQLCAPGGVLVHGIITRAGSTSPWTTWASSRSRTSRAPGSRLARQLANEGTTTEAMAWAEAPPGRNPSRPLACPATWHGATIGRGAFENALPELDRMEKAWGDFLAAAHVRLDCTDDVRRVIAAFVRRTGYTVADAARWSLIEPRERRFPEDLRQFGMPDG